MFDSGKENLLNSSIAELAKKNKWPRQTMSAIVKLVHDPPHYFGRENRAKNQKIIDDLAAQTTLRECLTGLEKKYAEQRRSHYFYNDYRGILKRIIDLGLTRLDCVVIPQSTVTKDMLKSISKIDLLKKDASVLGTVSNLALTDYRHNDKSPKNPLPWPTVADLLSQMPYAGISEKSWKATRQLLEDLGFTYEDGLFLQWGTRRRFVEDLMKEEGYSRETCAIVAAIAEKRCWVKFPAENLGT